MIAAIRNLLAISLLTLFSLTTSNAASSQNDTAVAVKAKKKVQEARTLEGKKPKACDFRISLS